MIVSKKGEKRNKKDKREKETSELKKNKRREWKKGNESSGKVVEKVLNLNK